MTDSEDPKGPGQGEGMPPYFPVNIDDGPNSEPPSATDQEGFTVVGVNKPMATLVAEKQTMVGIQVTRTVKGDSRFSKQDMKCLLQIVADIDPEAIFINHAQVISTAKPLSEVLETCNLMDLNGAMDVQTFPWGHPQQGQKRTCFLFHVATNQISANIREVKQHPKYDDYCKLGKCTVQPSNLRQSRTKLMGLFSGKDPAHANRTDLANRMTTHLTTSSEQQHAIPVNIVPVTDSGIRSLGFAVGINDATKVQSILEKNPFPNVEVIMHAWKRSAKQAYHNRLQQHWTVCQQSTAFKLKDLDPHHSLGWLTNWMFNSPVKDFIVDVSPAVHAPTTGVVYVQYLWEHKEAVLVELEKFTKEFQNNPTDSPFAGKSIALVNPDSSLAPTRATGNSAGTSIVQVPVGKFAHVSTPQGMTIPYGPSASINRRLWTPAESSRQKPRSYCQALMADNNSSDSDDITVHTSNSREDSTLTSRTNKTKRELELEHANEELQQRLEAQQERHQHDMKQLHASHLALVQQQQQQMDMMQRQISELTSRLAASSQESPLRTASKRHKPSDTPNQTPVKESSSAFQRRIQTMTGALHSLAVTVAPPPNNDMQPAQPTPDVLEGMDQQSNV